MEHSRVALTPQILDIDAIVAGGDGLARQADGPVIFVPRTVPGERVEVEIVEQRRQFARGRALRILESSPSRRDPICPHYSLCGGCQLQHIEYDSQLAAKAGVIAESLRRLGGIEVEPPTVVPSGSEFEYRNRITLVLRRTGDGVVAGYHALESPGEIVDIDHCPLAEPALNRVWAGLRANWGGDAEQLPPGAELRMTLRAGSDGRVGLAIEGAEGRGAPDALLDSVDGLASIWSLGPDGTFDWHVGSAALTDRWGETELQLAGTAFVQVNREVATKLEQHVRALCGDVSGLAVVDAYCGYGLRTVDLAVAGADAVGIDSNHGAIAAAESAAIEFGASTRFVAAPVEAALHSELPADLVILNPPRRGVASRVVETLLADPPARIIYVSCNPATLARDAKLLSARFRVEACRGFDMFPQTAHVESVLMLVRGD
ncbi:MAG: class I SAM-dependent RNA methyltransferase [Planctomycetota bacterium]|jgi:23S rRNA (uracil1939-C5)-methyltransferase